MVGNTTKVQAVYDKIAQQHAQYREVKGKAARETRRLMSADTVFKVAVVGLAAAIVYTVVTIIIR